MGLRCAAGGFGTSSLLLDDASTRESAIACETGPWYRDNDQYARPSTNSSRWHNPEKVLLSENIVTGLSSLNVSDSGVSARIAIATAASTHGSLAQSPPERSSKRFFNMVDDEDDRDLRKAVYAFGEIVGPLSRGSKRRAGNSGEWDDVMINSIKSPMEPMCRRAVDQVDEGERDHVAIIHWSLSEQQSRLRNAQGTQPSNLLTLLRLITSRILSTNKNRAPHREVVRDENVLEKASGNCIARLGQHPRKVRHTGRGRGSRTKTSINVRQGHQRSLTEILWMAFRGVFNDVRSTARQKSQEVAGHLSGFSHKRAVKWVSLAAAVSVKDIPTDTEQAGGHHDSAALIAADMPRLQCEPNDTKAVESILRGFCAMYPGVGYNQGYDSACLAMYIATGRNSSATLPVFAKWAACTGRFMFHRAHGKEETACEKAAVFARSVLRRYASYVSFWLSTDPVLFEEFDDGGAQTLLANAFLRPLVSLCSRLAFRREVLGDIVDQSLARGSDAPVVCLWVACTLICMAAKEDVGRRFKRGEVMSVAKRLDQVSAKVRSFQQLEAAACTPLPRFVQGCRDAIASASCSI